jgi:F0F1-type ATP synthase delta subunit
VDETNLAFLLERAKEEKINGTISLARVVWQNVPELRHIMDSELIKELSRTTLESVQERINRVLEPMKAFIESFPTVIERLPDDLKKDIDERFDQNRIALEKEFKALIELSPTSEEMTKTIQVVVNQIESMNRKQIEEMEQLISKRFKETLERMGFPEPEQLKLLSRLMPETLPLLQQLLHFQKVPSEKGRQGEVELIQLLEEYYPEDDCQPLGGSGDIDALAIPRFNGTSLGQKILIESKKNSSGWKRSFIEQVRNHMKLRGERFAILAVDVMPKNSNGFFFEQCSEGVILVTNRSFFHVSYGAVRSALIALQPFLHRDIDFRRLFAEKKISEAIDEACRYSEWTKRLREKAQRIDTNTKGIIEDVNQLDSHLRRSLEELQTRINEAVVQIEATETKPIIAPS